MPSLLYLTLFLASCGHPSQPTDIADALESLNSVSVAGLLNDGKDRVVLHRTSGDVLVNRGPRGERQNDLQIIRWNGETLVSEPFPELSPPLPAGTSYSYTRPAFKDVDGDGQEDLIALEQDGESGHFYRWLGEEQGYAAGIGFEIATEGRSTFHDVDGDGLIDLVIRSDEQQMQVHKWCKGDGAGQFGAPQPMLEDRWLTQLEMHDLNGDNILDVTTSGSRYVKFWPGQADGSYGPAERVELPMGRAHVIYGPVDGRGGEEIIAAWSGTDHVLVLSYNDGEWQRHPVSMGQPIDEDSLHITDLNNDQRPELVAYHQAGDAADGMASTVIAVSRNDDGTWSASHEWEICGDAKDLMVADLNGDGAEEPVMIWFDYAQFERARAEQKEEGEKLSTNEAWGWMAEQMLAAMNVRTWLPTPEGDEVSSCDLLDWKQAVARAPLSGKWNRSRSFCLSRFTNGIWRVDLNTQNRTLLNAPPDLPFVPQRSGGSAMSEDGQVIAFSSQDPSLVPFTPPETDKPPRDPPYHLYVVDTKAQTVSRHAYERSFQNVALSDDGRVLSASTQNPLPLKFTGKGPCPNFIETLATGTQRCVSPLAPMALNTDGSIAMVAVPEVRYRDAPIARLEVETGTQTPVFEKDLRVHVMDSTGHVFAAWNRKEHSLVVRDLAADTTETLSLEQIYAGERTPTVSSIEFFADNRKVSFRTYGELKGYWVWDRDTGKITPNPEEQLPCPMSENVTIGRWAPK